MDIKDIISFLPATDFLHSPAFNAGLIKEVLDVTELTAEEMKADPNREYNPAEWVKRVSSFEKLGARFFKAAPQRGYGYDRFYAVYKSSEGILFWNSVSYSSSLTNAGFVQVIISSDFTVFTKLFSVGNETGRLENCAVNRKIMADHSSRWATVYANNI